MNASNESNANQLETLRNSIAKYLKKPFPKSAFVQAKMSDNQHATISRIEIVNSYFGAARKHVLPLPTSGLPLPTFTLIKSARALRTHGRKVALRILSAEIRRPARVILINNQIISAVTYT